MQVKKIAQNILSAAASKKFFYVVVGVFVVSSVWIALTSRYPMAFDENYHYGIIQQYAKQWSPFFGSVPTGSEQLGDITRFPSYLWHYLLSFPYRLASLFTELDSIKIVFLRLINIGLLTASLFVFKRLFEEAKLSRGLTNLSILFFTLIPITPFLAAHISYDNPSILLTAYTLLFALRILNGLRVGEFRSNTILLLLVTGILSSLIKYTYLPIFAIVMLYLLVAYFWFQRKHRFKPIKTTRKNFFKLAPAKRVFLVAGLVLSVVLGIERYGYNMVVYKTPVPDCAQVLSETSCKQYGPWGRDFRLKARRQRETPNWKIKDYNKIWLRTSLVEFSYAIKYDYYWSEPIAFVAKFSKIMLVVGGVLSLLWSFKILKNPALRLFTVTFLLYVAAVWIDNYSKFYAVHWPVAVHGRYLLPLVPIALVVLGYGYFYTLSLVPVVSQELKALAVISVIGASLYGGGILTYLALSEQSWYWQNDIVITVNSTVKKLVDPLIR